MSDLASGTPSALRQVPHRIGPPEVTAMRPGCQARRALSLSVPVLISEPTGTGRFGIMGRPC
jgi:hypothetical protein